MSERKGVLGGLFDNCEILFFILVFLLLGVLASKRGNYTLSNETV